MLICYESDRYEPFLDVLGKGENDSTEGYLIQLSRWAAKKSGFSAEYIRRPWSRCLNMVKMGTANAAFSVIYTPQRAKSMRYPKGADKEQPEHFLWKARYPFFVARGSNFSFQNYRQKPKAGIGAPFGYVPYKKLKEQGLLAPFDLSLEQGLQMVAAGKIDGYVVETQIGLSAVKKLKLSEKIQVTSDILMAAHWHIPFNKTYYRHNQQQVKQFWGNLQTAREQVEAPAVLHIPDEN
ncbi:substrate-binding periplasmic protein [Lacimicrobium alkaliphilum]|uniref:Solute-binding protein family 3/N-terminal domain-containing protein n=1 Tax=Lacimicrobium alkaliphilum TaxID=1526571 RepID=A0ABQ1R8F6_9ALTE|nr:transporter substrate-binding domain-containing protein [Lacimicrobium alkaliphilum]GGD59156.1 hypothetical protein GCM10011357_13060 [Lacimicrobium alkaliphilum]